MKIDLRLIFGRGNNEDNEESANPTRLTINDWFSFLGNQSSNALSNMMAVGALTFAAIALLRVSEFGDNTDYLLLTFSGLVAVIALCIVIYYYFFDQHRISSKLLTDIINNNLDDPQIIRKSWLEENQKYTILRKIVSGIIMLFGAALIGLVLFPSWFTPSSSSPCVEDAPYKVNRPDTQTIYTNNYQLKDGAIVIQGSYTDAKTYHDKTLFILDDSVTIVDRSSGD